MDTSKQKQDTPVVGVPATESEVEEWRVKHAQQTGGTNQAKTVVLIDEEEVRTGHRTRLAQALRSFPDSGPTVVPASELHSDNNTLSEE